MSKRTTVLLFVALLCIIIIFPAASVLAAGTNFTVTTVDDGQDANPGDGICATNGAVCTLRAAIEESNANDGLDTIEFGIATGVQTIKYTSVLPTITDPVIIDGTTQPGYLDSPLIVLDGSAVTDPEDTYERYGLRISAGSSTVRGLAIIKFNAVGIYMEANGDNLIENNYIGVNAAGTSGAGNKRDGIRLDDAHGTQLLNNVISSNTGTGITVSDSSNVVIQGNIIGLTAAGTNPLGNGSDGIYITTWDTSSSNIAIGGSEEGQGNVISSNGRDGIHFAGSAEMSENLLIQGNLIGSDLNGNQDRGNKNTGIYMYNALDVVIGGTEAGEGNLISGNDEDGISVSWGDGITIYGNIIGANANGNAPLGNGGSGINTYNAPTRVNIGGPENGMGNIISANGESGIYLFDTSTITIQGNFIGTNPAGGALGNLEDGIYIDDDSDGNIIGGITGNEANWIAFNNLAGVRVYGQANSIRGNTIVANTLVGIDLRIAGVQNALSSPNVTPNDLGDGDTGGNNLQNFPVITNADIEGNDLVIKGGLNSSYVTSFVLDFYINGSCDVAENGEGAVYIGTLEDVTTDNDGNAAFTVTVPAPEAGTIVTATATDSGNNTSEFSACVTIVGTAPEQTPPVVTNPGNQTSAEGATVNLAIVATDAEADPLTYSAVNLPTGLTISTNTGVITGTVAAGSTANSPYNVTVSVSDGAATSQTNFTWTISDIPAEQTPPVVTNPGNQTSVEGATVNLTIVATDAEADPLTYSAVNLPTGLTISTNTGVITGTVAAGAAANSPYNVTVSVSDGAATSPTNFTWTIIGNVEDLLERVQPTEGQVITDSSQYSSKFQWTAQEDAEWYHLYIADVNYSRVYLDTWYKASEVCEGELCTTLDNIWILNNGDYIWWMTYWNAAVGDSYTELYNSMTFTMDLDQPVIGALTRTSPMNGQVITNRSQYVSNVQWLAQEDAEWYHVYIADAHYTTLYLDAWYQASDVCEGTLCTAPDEIWLGSNGEYVWWMTYWNESVNDIYNEMYTSTTFTINMGQPAALTGTLPNGQTNNGNITVQWNAEPNTLWYQVWTGPADYSETSFLGWVNAADVCTETLCSVQIPGTQPVGNYEIWLMQWNPAGVRDWQLTSEYTITP